MDSHDNEPRDDFPAPPDLQRVREMRTRLRADQAASGNRRGRLRARAGQAAGDIGKYTLIPSLMIAGPVVGYGLGSLVEKYIGGAPWGVVFGMLLGVVAAFRQIFLLLTKKGES